MDGWLRMRASDEPVYYIGTPPDEVAHDWLLGTKTRKVAELFQEGRIKVPGFTNSLSEERPLEQPPPRPQLNALTFKGSEDNNDLSLSLPEGIVKLWAGHPVFGSEFELFLGEFYSQFSEEAKSPDGLKTPTPKKRSRP